jgi:hypothetical protein
MEHEIRWLRTYVIQTLQDAFGDRPEIDSDGDVAVRQGTAACYVSCHDGGFPVVRVWAIAATGLRPQGKLLREINDVNAGTMTAHVYFANGLVYVEQNLHAYGVDEDTLGQAFLAVAGVANNIGSLMAMALGGDTPFPADTEDADAHDEAA